MDENLWRSFEQSGKIEDYLKYKGINAINKTDCGSESYNAGNNDRRCNQRACDSREL